jgi:hypothetical protein
MILLTILVVFAAAIAGVYWHLGKQPDRRSLLRRTLQIGLVVGLARAALASWGWYTVEHTGGPLQIPAFALAMLAWPEAAIFLAERRTTPVPPEFYVRLSVLLVAGTLVLVGAVALAARRPHTPFQSPPT